MIDTAKWSFAVGHFFNDLCASMWFFFTLPYFTKVLKLNSGLAGDILLIGQVCDAISTPLIGIESDRKGFICGSKFGTRKSWHMLGTILTVISFPFIFISFFNIEDTKDWYLIIYYTPFVAVFQFAWATVQVTHLSLIPIMVQEGEDNSTLNSLRYMFTIAANVVVLGSTTLLFQFLPFPAPATNLTNIHPSEFNITPHDQSTFTYLSLGIVAVGFMTSIIFHLGVKEKELNVSNKDESSEAHTETEITSLMKSLNIHLSKRDWFKEPQFYLVNCLYLSSRLIVNVSQLYLVMYVVDTLGLPKITGPLAALTTFGSGAVTSIILKRIQQRIGKKVCLLTGLLFVSAYCVMVSFSYFCFPIWRMYLSMAILGIGCSTIMIGSLSITADLIGKSISSSAFVYGCMSFSDKLSSGIVVWLLQRFGPDNGNCFSCRTFYLDIQLYFVGSCALFAFVILLILFPMNIGVRRRDRSQIINSKNYTTSDEST